MIQKMIIISAESHENTFNCFILLIMILLGKNQLMIEFQKNKVKQKLIMSFMNVPICQY